MRGFGVEYEEVVTLRRIYEALDVDDSGSVDEWELWNFLQVGACPRQRSVRSARVRISHG